MILIKLCLSCHHTCCPEDTPLAKPRKQASQRLRAFPLPQPLKKSFCVFPRKLPFSYGSTFVLVEQSITLFVRVRPRVCVCACRVRCVCAARNGKHSSKMAENCQKLNSSQKTLRSSHLRNLSLRRPFCLCWFFLIVGSLVPWLRLAARLVTVLFTV
jgi:hypothetical protein